MKIYALAILVGMMTLHSIGQVTVTPSKEDPYDISLVRSLISQQQHPPVVSVGSFDKYVYRAGDRMAISLLKIYDEQELVDRSNVRVYLPIIREAFSAPNLIDRKDDREPKVSLFLLHFVEKNLKDEDTRKEVTQLISTLAELSTPPAK